MNVFLFSETFPYGFGETFLENELPFLADEFEQVVIIPLHKKEGIRALPSNVTVWDPIIGFSPKDRKRMLRNGIFNLSPIGFSAKDFFDKKVFSNKKWCWNFFTSLFLFRAMASNKKLWKQLAHKVQAEDILYFYWGDKSVLILPSLKRKIQNKAFVRFHRTDLYEYAKNGYIPFRKYIFSSIDHFLPISENGKQYLIQHYPQTIDPSKIKVNRLGVFDNGLNLEINNSVPFHLVSCSYMVPVKRIALIVESLKHISFPLKWTHIGTGVLFDEIRCKTNSLPENVEIDLKGVMSNAEVINFYQQNHVDLFINVSESEGVPVSIMEALSFGIPVAATDVGGTAEIVDEKVGKLLPKDITANDIAQTISNFKSLSKQNDFRKNARVQWSELCDAKKNYLEFVKLLI